MIRIFNSHLFRSTTQLSKTIKYPFPNFTNLSKHDSFSSNDWQLIDAVWKTLDFQGKLQYGVDSLQPEDARAAIYKGFALLEPMYSGQSYVAFEDAIRLSMSDARFNEKIRHRAIHKLDQLQVLISKNAHEQEYIGIFDLDPNEEKQWYS
jgi:hypothetical protein